MLKGAGSGTGVAELSGVSGFWDFSDLMGSLLFCSKPL